MTLLLASFSGHTAIASEAIKSKLQSTDPVDLFKAAEDAAATKDVENAGALLEAGWQSLHPHIAVACGDALAAIGPGAAADAEYAKVLAKALKAKDIHGQQNLARVLGAYGDASVDEPLSYLAGARRPPDVQAEALYMCGGLKVKQDRPFTRCIEAIGAGLRSKTSLVQMAASSAASRIRDLSFVDGLTDIARTSQHQYAGLYAVWALARMGQHVRLGAFVHVLESEAKRETINACLKAVTDLTATSDIPELLTMTRSPRKDLRDAACIAIGRLAKEGAFLGPARTGEPGSPPPPVPDAPADVLDRLIQIVEGDAAWEVRDAASRALLRIGEGARNAVTAKMPPMVDAAEPDVALTAMELCGDFKVAESFRAILKTATFDKDLAKRMFAARALGSIDPAKATEELLADIHKDRKGRPTTINMVRALGYIRFEAAFLGLIQLAVSTECSEGVRSEAERSLERLTGRRFGRSADTWAKWYAKAKGHEPFRPHLGKYDRTKNRREAVAKRLYGLSDETERAVEQGLRWMELQQHDEGAWDGSDKGMLGVINCLPAYTGLALLAYLGAGYDGVHGKYREQIRRAAEFLAATQFYDGGFPVTGGGDSSWIFAYLTGMGVWAVTEAYALSQSEDLRGASQRGIDYLCRVQTAGAGWRYGPRYIQTDTSCTSWVLMTLKTASLVDIEIPQKAFDGIDSWLERCSYDITGEEEKPDDMATDYDKEVGVKRQFKAFTSYFVLSGKEETSPQQTSMTAVGMVCRFFMGWQRSNPFLIGSANYLLDYLPQWRKGLEKGQAIAWYFYFWYYGTLAMHQMGGRYWRAWNEKIKVMLPTNQRTEPPAVAGSWDPDSAVLNGGRMFSTAMAVLTLETYYRFSPLMLPTEEETTKKKPGAGGAVGGGAAGGGAAAGGGSPAGGAGMGEGTPAPDPAMGSGAK